MKKLFPLLLGAGAACALLSSLRAPHRALSPNATGATGGSTYEIDTSHSTVLFRTKHLGISQAYGRFDKFEGQVVYDDANPAKSSIVITIDTASVDTNHAKRDGDLKGPDFFSAKEFPEIVFESKKVTGTKDKLEVSGELTLHGETKTVTAQAELVGQGEAMQATRAGFEAHFRIDMRDFGFGYVQKNPGALGPEVDLTISLECIKK